MAFCGPQGAIHYAGHASVISAYHKAHGLVKHSQLEAYYRTLTGGLPSNHGLNDMIYRAWKLGLAP
jgi:hypothetical protein